MSPLPLSQHQLHALAVPSRNGSLPLSLSRPLNPKSNHLELQNAHRSISTHSLLHSLSLYRPIPASGRREGYRSAMGKRRGSPLNKLFAWVRRQSMKVKIFLAVISFLSALVALKHLVKDRDHFFIASEAIHVAGIVVLIYKLTTQRSCSGLSLKTQGLTSIFLAVRLYCSFLMEGDIHTILDFATLVSTVWVIYMMRFKLKATYIEELDNMAAYYLLVPCAVLAILIHPYSHQTLVSRILWAFCVYLESISVLPQLRMMQNVKMIEPFTAHYVFALGIARFLGCAHWIIQVYDTSGRYLSLVGIGYFWILMTLLAEMVQTFILADFCYYYIKSVMNGELLISLPSPV